MQAQRPWLSRQRFAYCDLLRNLRNSLSVAEVRIALCAGTPTLCILAARLLSGIMLPAEVHTATDKVVFLQHVPERPFGLSTFQWS